MDEEGGRASPNDVEERGREAQKRSAAWGGGGRREMVKPDYEAWHDIPYTPFTSRDKITLDEYEFFLNTWSNEYGFFF